LVTPLLAKASFDLRLVVLAVSYIASWRRESVRGHRWRSRETGVLVNGFDEDGGKL